MLGNGVPTPCDPASPRRCVDSGSSSDKFLTGHGCIGDQVHRGKSNSTGRQRARIVIRTINRRFRNIFNRFLKNYSCLSNSSVDVVPLREATVQTEKGSNCRDTVLNVPTAVCEHVSNCSDTTVPTSQCDHVSHSSDKSVDEVVVPTAESDHVSNCSAHSVDQPEAPMVQSDETKQNQSPVENLNSSPPRPNRRVIRFVRPPVQLHQASQPWKARKDSSSNDLTRKAKSILNKISPENFEKLTNQLKLLNIDDETDATNLANILFQKAVEDQTYAYLYAKVCKELSWSFYVILEANDMDDFDWVVNFRFIVAMKAKAEFEKLLQSTGEPSSSQRRYNRGILNFLAELMNENVLTRRVAEHQILKALVQRWSNNVSDHYTIECLCTFLAVAGKTLDFPNKQQQAESRRTVNLCFELLQVLTEPKGLLNSRLRFMILDVLDLRKNLWIKTKR